MGYLIEIGELLTEVEDDGLCSYLYNTVKRIYVDEAPKIQRGVNSISPSYSTWSDVCKVLGITDLMFDTEYGLMHEHPGCVPITKEHKELFDIAYTKFYKDNVDINVDIDSERDVDQAAVRLEWLRFWIEWALINCNVPVFYNS